MYGSKRMRGCYITKACMNLLFYEYFSLFFPFCISHWCFSSIFQCVAWLLRKVMQVIEQRISTQAENLKIVKYFMDLFYA